MSEKREKGLRAWGGGKTAAHPSPRPAGADLGTGQDGGRKAASAAATGGGASSPPGATLGNSVYTGSLCRLFFEESEPLRALDMALRFYLRTYGSDGRVRIRVLGPDRAEILLAAGKDSRHPPCSSTLAYLRDAVHLATGCRVNAREHRCVHKGDSCCAHQIHWEPVGA